MSPSSARPPVWRTLNRVLAVFTVLCGLLMMHGLSGDHDLNSSAGSPWAVSDPGPQNTSRTSETATPTIAQAALPAAEGHSGHRVGSIPALANLAVAQYTKTPTPSHGGESGHGAEQACLALLSASMAGVACALTLTRLRAFTASMAGRRPSQNPLRYGAVGTRPPSLSSLCLSRT